MSEQEIKPRGFKWGPCPKCEFGYMFKKWRELRDGTGQAMAVRCRQCGFHRGFERPADYRALPEPPWKPEVGDRVVDPSYLYGRAGYVSSLRLTLAPTCFVQWDDGEKDVIALCDLRPETQADRERRAREIVKGIQDGKWNRFRVIDRPVYLDGTYKHSNVTDLAGSVVTVASKYGYDAIYIREHEGQTIAAWNLVPLPAEPEAEPRLWVWREGDFRPLYKGEKYLCGKAVLTAGGYSSQPAYVVCPLPSDEVEALREFFDATNAYLFDPMNMRLDEKVAKARERVLAAREKGATK